LAHLQVLKQADDRNNRRVFAAVMPSPDDEHACPNFGDGGVALFAAEHLVDQRKLPAHSLAAGGRNPISARHVPAILTMSDIDRITHTVLSDVNAGHWQILLSWRLEKGAVVSAFGDKVAEYRKNFGMTQRRLAERSDLDATYLNRIEKGTRPPPPVDTIRKIVQALGLSDAEAKDLVGLADPSIVHTLSTVRSSLSVSARTRDDFSAKTIAAVAARAGYVCSNPTCRRSTAAPHPTEPDRAINAGVAAHIAGASPGGPRYKLSQTSEQRTSAENAIWLCQQCSRVIDAAPEAFPVDTLVAWKRYAEERAARNARNAGDQITPLMHDIDRASALLAEFAGNPRYDILSLRPAADGDEHGTRTEWDAYTDRLIRQSFENRAMFIVQVMPDVIDVLHRAEVVLGSDSAELKAAKSAAQHAEVNPLAMISAAKALQQLRTELSLR
jgi:transcriptional regulator with XRE-family HTH domain